MLNNNDFPGFDAQNPDAQGDTAHNELSTAQLFQLELLRRQIETLPLDESHDYLFELFRQMMVKDNLVRDMFKSCYL